MASQSNNVGLCVSSRDFQTAFAAGSIELPMDSCGVFSLMRRGEQAMANSRYSDAARMMAPVKMDDVLQRISVV